MATIQDISPKEFQEGIQQENIQLIDVRTPAEYGEGHIAGATLINIQEHDFRDKIDELPHDKPVYVYCRSGARSGAAMRYMETAGFQEVYNLKGGILAWEGEVER